MKKLVKVPTQVSKHLFGDNHTDKHKIITGVMFMIVGYGISKIADQTSIHLLAEMTGFFLHGLGATPIIEVIRKIS